MKNNKTYTGLIIVYVLTMCFAACSKSFTSADNALLGPPKADDFWADADSSSASKAVTAMYGSLRTWNNTAFAAIAVESLGSDDAIKGSVATDAPYMNLYDNFTVTPTEGQMDGFWTGQYQNINFCNQVLDHVPSINMDANLKSRYLAEAKFIRAYSYFRLVRAFGHIPLILHVPSTPDEINPVQTESSAVYDSIEKDLTDAAAILPSQYGSADAGRATKGAALALHAKVAMYRKNWQEVLDYTNQVIQSGVYSLYTDFYQMFRIEHENNSESVFEIQCTYVAGNDDMNSSQYSQVQGNPNATPNAGWGFNVPTQDLINEFEPGDPRLHATVMFPGDVLPSGDTVPKPNPGEPTYYNLKSYVPFNIAAVSPNQGCGQNVRVIRYGEVLLMNAEANNELGNITAAAASLEKVRARARNMSKNPSSVLPEVQATNQTSMRNAIWHERRVELAMEFDRYFDVIRQGRAAQIFGPLGWKSNKNEVWPIPQNEIDISAGKLVQNQGY